MMPDTYTQEQIDDIATALYGWTALPRILPSAPGTGPDWDIGADIRAILSALSTAEQERDALKARVVELEARLQGAADRAVEYMHDLWDGWSDEELRAAIVKD